MYATAAKAPLIFRQIVGRFVRTSSGHEPTPSWLYLPADPVLRRHAEAIESELRQASREQRASDFGEEREPRTAGEPGEAAGFQPLSADVSPQMTLLVGRLTKKRPARSAA